MSKTSFGSHNRNGRSGRRGGAVTVIQHNVAYSYLRTAKITFYVVLAIVGLFSAVIASYYLPPITAIPIGLVAGTLVGGLIASIIAIWPILRAIWWWLPEITLTLGVVGSWMYLQALTNPIITGLVYGGIILTLGLIPPLRLYTYDTLWCLALRHRLRTCFTTFMPADRHGHLPFIGWAKPIPVGARVWVWLRPGLSLEQIEHQLGKIAVACWAASVTVTKASASNSALIRLDIKRRDVFGGLVGSPLTDDLPTGFPVDPAADMTSPTRSAFTVPDQLDLVDIPDSDESLSVPRQGRKNGRSPAPNDQPTVVTTNPDHDWI